MSGRTIAEVESSIEKHRGEFAEALTDFRAGIAQGQRQVEDAKQRLPGEVRSRLEREAGQARARLEQEIAGRGDQLAAVATGIGFVGGGGVGGAARLPLRVLGTSSFRTEVTMGRRDRHSKQVGRALAGVAMADRQLRRRRGFLFVNVRRLVVLAPIAAGAAALMAKDGDLPIALIEPREKLLDRIFAE